MTSKRANGIRAFIALDLSQEAKHRLEQVQAMLRRQIGTGSVRWVKRQAFHLTLFFLGDGNGPAEVKNICDLLDEIGNSHRPLRLALAELGCFPHPRRPKVIWIGLGGETTALDQLKAAVDEGVTARGWRPEKRPFTPHLTLGRVKDPLGIVNHAVPYEKMLAEVDWSVSKIHLYQSTLTPQGARYTKIHSAAFSAG